MTEDGTRTVTLICSIESSRAAAFRTNSTAIVRRASWDEYLISTLFCIELHHPSLPSHSIYTCNAARPRTHPLRDDASIPQIRLLDVVGHSLGLLKAAMMVIMAMAIVLGADILHLEDVAALAAALVGAGAAQRHPQLVVRVGGHPRAPHVLLVARRPHHDRVFECPQP